MPLSSDLTKHIFHDQLTRGVAVALPLIAIRLAYGVAFLLLRVTNPSSSFAKSVVAEIVLEVVTEVLVALVFTFVGLRTTKMAKESRKWSREEEPVEVVDEISSGKHALGGSSPRGAM